MFSFVSMCSTRYIMIMVEQSNKDYTMNCTNKLTCCVDVFFSLVINMGKNYDNRFLMHRIITNHSFQNIFFRPK